MFHNKHALKQFGHQLVSLGSLQKRANDFPNLANHELLQV